MKFYDANGKQLKDKDAVNYSTGRYLQDKSDPEKYVFSPWNTVPAREEEHVPEMVPTNAELAKSISQNSSDITDVQVALADIYESIAAASTT